MLVTSNRCTGYIDQKTTSPGHRPGLTRLDGIFWKQNGLFMNISQTTTPRKTLNTGNLRPGNRGGILHRLLPKRLPHFAVLHAVGEVNNHTHSQPDNEPVPFHPA